MRVSDPQRKRRVGRILRCIPAAIALCAVAMPCVAMNVVQTQPHLWASATALSLILASAAARPKQ
jgi:hypothetical protein